MLSKRQLFLEHIAQTSELPLLLEIERAEGVFIYDSSGKKYYDLNSGINVSSLGHNHPKVMQAIEVQLKKNLHTMVYGEHIHSPQVKFAELLTAEVPNNLNSIYYLLSGSEAIELAMKLAKRYTGRREIMSCSGAYHGSTQGAESLRSDHEYSRAFLPLLPGIRHIAFNDFEQIKHITEKTAAIILEPVQAESGVILPANDYLKAVRKRCDKTGTLMILDEIQTGFGRTGYLFAFQKYGLVPDVLCIGKSMGGGLPLSGVVSSKKILSSLTSSPALGHITTFGGHPLSCAAATASLEMVSDKNFLQLVLENEAFIHRKLVHPIIEEIRSSGMMMAVQLSKRKYLKHVVNQAFELGALVDYFLFNRSSFRLAPPLIYSRKELTEAMEILLAAMDFARSQYKS